MVGEGASLCSKPCEVLSSSGLPLQGLSTTREPSSGRPLQTLSTTKETSSGCPLQTLSTTKETSSGCPLQTLSEASSGRPLQTLSEASSGRPLQTQSEASSGQFVLPWVPSALVERSPSKSESQQRLGGKQIDFFSWHSLQYF